eukprot:TRINITY_DN272_c0_g1_i6.p1 TRINITY_DN272_c0_g1~~TRINITY_DN272_c0_g1_i6.p1  ORF type:complete len:408 (+),score=107.88 TRINITY_DN272_c0_g1_i6:184-1407(+)
MQCMFRPPRPVYLRETLAYLSFCETKRTEPLRTVRVQAQDLGTVHIKDHDFLRTLAHTEVERRNSDTRFLHEFRAQIAKAGHTLEIVLPKEEGASTRLLPSTFDLQRLFSARGLRADEYSELREKRNFGRDEGDEKLAVARYECLEFYGLKQVPSWTDFNDFFVTLACKRVKQPFYGELTFLLKVLVEGQNLEEGGLGKVMHDGPMADVAREIIKAMGLEHPFDMRPTRSLKGEGLRDTLLSTAFFKRKDYSIAGKWASELFGGIRFPPHNEEWTGERLRDALNKLWGHMGLQVRLREVKGSRGRYKKGVSRAGMKDHTLVLDADGVDRLSKLAKLQFREVHMWWKHRLKLKPGVREFLILVDVSSFDSLLARPSGHPLLAEVTDPKPEPVEKCELSIPAPRRSNES